MEIGFIGVGKMGLNMVKRLLADNHRVVCTARTSAKLAEIESMGALWARDLPHLKRELKPPRAIWLMVPSGSPTQEVIDGLCEILDKGDLIIDGGNSDYRDSIRRGKVISMSGYEFLDVGTSGGIWGLEKGYCLMVGGRNESALRMKEVFDSLAPKDGWLHVGDTGSGHFVKMVHNAIEYGMMQAYAEGFDLLENSGMNLESGKIARLWNQGSVVRSWLLELSESIFAEPSGLKEIKGFVEDSGECRWAIETGIEKGVPLPVLSLSLFERFSSRRVDSFPHKFLAALRNKFGGHSVKKA